MNTVRVRVGQHGFTLLEVLITLMVMSIGLLGLAGLFTTGLRFDQEAYLRSQAVVFLDDMAGRIQANPDAARLVGGGYDNYTGTASASCVTPSGCSPTAMAQYDSVEWRARVASVLPQGVGVACIDSNVDDGADCDGALENADRYVYLVKVTWFEREGDTTQTLRMQVIP